MSSVSSFGESNYIGTPLTSSPRNRRDKSKSRTLRKLSQSARKKITSIDEPVLYPELKSELENLRTQRRRETDYVIPSPFDYSPGACTISHRRSQCALVGLTDPRSYSHWSENCNPPPGVYNISDNALVVSTVQMHPPRRQRKTRRKNTCIEDIAFELGISESTIQRYMTFRDTDMIDQAVGKLARFIQNNPISDDMKHEIARTPFLTSNSEFNEYIRTKKMATKELLLYAYGLMTMFKSRMDISSPLYKFDTQHRRYGSALVNSRPSCGRFARFVNISDDDHDLNSRLTTEKSPIDQLTDAYSENSVGSELNPKETSIFETDDNNFNSATYGSSSESEDAVNKPERSEPNQ